MPVHKSRFADWEVGKSIRYCVWSLDKQLPLCLYSKADGTLIPQYISEQALLVMSPPCRRSEGKGLGLMDPFIREKDAGRKGSHSCKKKNS